MSTIVLTFFTTSDAYKADLDVGTEGMELISACDGILENYHAVAMENNNVGFTIEITTSGEAFKAIVANEELFNKILEKMLVTRVGGIEQYHTNPISDPRKALAGPVTEVCLVTLKNPTPENRKAFETLGKAFEEITEGKWTYGWTVEDSNKAIILAAWDSIEAHQARGQEPDVADALNEFLALIDTNGGPFHANLVKV